MGWVLRVGGGYVDSGAQLFVVLSTHGIAGGQRVLLAAPLLPKAPFLRRRHPHLPPQPAFLLLLLLLLFLFHRLPRLSSLRGDAGQQARGKARFPGKLLP